MPALKTITETNRISKLGTQNGIKNNGGVRVSEINEIINRLNSITTDNGILSDSVSVITPLVTAGNGTVGAPAITFTSDLDSGMYRIGANEIGIGVNGAVVLDVATTGLSVTGTLSSTGLLTAVTTNPIAKPVNTGSIATGAVLTGPQVLSGYMAVTGGTGNVQFPPVSEITTALGTSPAGTVLELIINATGMTATNVATFTVNTNLTFLKQTSVGDSGSAALATVTQTAGVHIGVFKLIFDTATSVVVARIA